jgi:hypothetical protein
LKDGVRQVFGLTGSASWIIHARSVRTGNVAAKEGVLRVPLGFGFELGEEAHFASDVDCYGDAILVEHAVAGECGDARIG